MYRPHRFEQRIAGYWIEALLALSDPASYIRAASPRAGGRRGPDVVARASTPRRRGRCATRRCRSGSGGEAVEALAETCQQRIDAVYETIATATGATTRAFLRREVDPACLLARRELYPNGRELFLVRDFRDMVCSMLAFNEQARRERLRARRGGQRHGVREHARRPGHLARARLGAPRATARIWSATRTWSLDPERALPACSITWGWTRARTPSRPCGRARGGHTGAARARDQRLRPELDRPLAHGTSTPSWPRPASARFRPGAGAVRLRAAVGMRPPGRSGTGHGTVTRAETRL